MSRVLWIEDAGYHDLAIMAGYVHAETEHSLVIAANPTKALNEIMEAEYDAVVVDIRIPPGDDPVWLEIYRRAGSDIKAAKLGLHLLETVLQHPGAKVKRTVPDWLTSRRFGVFTIEPNLQAEMERLQIPTYILKNRDIAEDTLAKVIGAILTRAGKQ